MTPLSEQNIITIKDAARKLTGYKRRAFQAKVAIDYLDSKPRLAETTFNWGRNTVELGLNELRTGVICLDSYMLRGNKKTEHKNQRLEIDICCLADPKSQIDPKFQTTFQYTRITASAMRNALIREKNWHSEDLPCVKTIGNILNRLGYRLRRVQKAKPIKKIKETDQIFDNLDEINQASDAREDSLRISIDTKAKVDLCDSSRGGTSRCKKAIKADDHDMGIKSKLTPFGIQDVMSGWLTIIFGVSYETSDFIVDCLEQWWTNEKDRYKNIKQLVINLDNGPQNSSQRTQFMKRMLAFSKKNGLEIVLAYYPPYHSKYNPIERSWGILENHWSGTRLNSIETTLEWAKSMTWKGFNPTVELLETIYEKGVSVKKSLFKLIEEQIERHEKPPKYHVVLNLQ